VNRSDLITRIGARSAPRAAATSVIQRGEASIGLITPRAFGFHSPDALMNRARDAQPRRPLRVTPSLT